MTRLPAAFAFVSAALAVACASRMTPPAGRAVPHGVGFQQVQAILRDNCEHCHNEDKAKGGLLMGSYEAILAGGEHGSAVIPGESKSSRLMQMIEGKSTPRMPYKEDPLSRSDIELIRRWIDEGAPPFPKGE